MCVEINIFKKMSVSVQRRSLFYALLHRKFTTFSLVNRIRELH